MKWILNLGILILPTLSMAQFNFMAASDWRTTKLTWTENDESNFGDFIARLGAAVERRQCGTVDTCFKSGANPYYSSDPKGLRYYSDCADLPYYLRSYFAWKNGLPMSVVSSVRARSVPDNTGDVRYTPFGNSPASRFDVVARNSGRSLAIYNIEDFEILASRYPDAVTLLNRTITDTTYSATFRMMGNEDGNLFSDFYPVKISRLGIRPGTVIYDPNGHVAIIYKVTDDGRIYYIDAHPDNTLTSGMYNPKFVRSNPYQGAGFKNFRPLTLTKAKKDSSGAYIGGRILGAKNDSLPYYSLEQFYGNQPDPDGHWADGKFIFNGQAVPYYDYVRIMMASGDLRINPLDDMQSMIQDICVNLKDRVDAVNISTKAGVYLKPHPERLPMNIYGTNGEWENYASPSRDARLKVSFMDVLNQSKHLIQRYKVGDPQIIYNGRDLPGDLLKVYNREARACQFSYTNSSGGAVTMDLEEARKRLFDMSFDPYHCPELRWGAKSPQELSSCRDDANKRAWYNQERWLRYQWERRYDVRMDFSLPELNGPKPGAGIANPPDIDIVRYLTSGNLR
ncbi:MAG: hypothetical protein J7501_03735 [Bdellovibrio sp.]|nr:hypothetical protein [Bdellovibrio sp.]